MVCTNQTAINDPDAPPEPTDLMSVAGVLCALVGSSMQALGLSLWRLHHLKQEAAEAKRLEALKRRRVHTQASGRFAVIHEIERRSHSMRRQEVPLSVKQLSITLAVEDPKEGPIIRDSSELFQREKSAQARALEAGFMGQKHVEGQDEVLAEPHESSGQNSSATGHSSGETDDFDRIVDVSDDRNGTSMKIMKETSDTGPPRSPSLAGFADEPEAPKTRYQKFKERIPWVWVGGFVIFALGNAGDFIAFGLTKQSIVTLVGSWTLVVNTFTARCLLNEMTTLYDILASACIICGIVMSVLFGGTDTVDWEIEELVARYQKTECVIMFLVLASMLGFGLVAMHVDHVARHAYAKRMETVVARPSRAIGALYCISGSLAADFTALFASAFSTILVTTMAGDNQFTEPFIGVIALVVVVSIPLQIYLIDQSLVVNSAMYHIPNFYVFWNTGAIITGAIFYQELACMSVSDSIGYATGVMILFLGVYLSNVSEGIKRQFAERDLKLSEWFEWQGGAGNEDSLAALRNAEEEYSTIASAYYSKLVGLGISPEHLVIASPKTVSVDETVDANGAAHAHNDSRQLGEADRKAVLSPGDIAPQSFEGLGEKLQGANLGYGDDLNKHLEEHSNEISRGCSKRGSLTPEPERADEDLRAIRANTEGVAFVPVQGYQTMPSSREISNEPDFPAPLDTQLQQFPIAESGPLHSWHSDLPPTSSLGTTARNFSDRIVPPRSPTYAAPTLVFQAQLPQDTAAAGASLFESRDGLSTMSRARQQIHDVHGAPLATHIGSESTASSVGPSPAIQPAALTMPEIDPMEPYKPEQSPVQNKVKEYEKLRSEGNINPQQIWGELKVDSVVSRQLHRSRSPHSLVEGRATSPSQAHLPPNRGNRNNSPARLNTQPEVSRGRPEGRQNLPPALLADQQEQMTAGLVAAGTHFT